MKYKFNYQDQSLAHHTAIATLSGSRKERKEKAERLLQLLPQRYPEIRGAYWSEEVDERKGVLSKDLKLFKV